MKVLIINIIIIFCSTILYCQSIDSLKNDIFTEIQKSETNSGKIKIYQEDRITGLVLKHIELNQNQNGFMGYRIQIYFGSGGVAKKKAEDMRDELEEIYPDVEAHIIYESPNFKLRVGDFRTKVEAYKFKIELSENYPSAFIVEDMIDFPILN